MSKGEILYIEDNFHNRRIVRKILERQDYILYDAEDGLEGYERLKELMPKVVLLDISLPTMDGIEIANRVKADPETRNVILIALTASAMAGDRERFLEAGCDDYLSKPFRAMDLVEMVDFYMSPSFVPSKSLSPGAKLIQSKEESSKPIANMNSLPKPDLSRKTKPRREAAEQALKSGNPGATNGRAATPSAKKPNHNSKPVDQRTSQKKESKSNGMVHKPRRGNFLSEGIGDVINADTLKPADPNQSEKE